MNLYLNELAPWERKDEYHRVVQLGSDVNKQTEVIRNASKQMIAAQFASTSAVIASQERIQELVSDGFEEVNCNIREVSQGIEGLKSAFQFGISEVVWQIEQNRQVLQNILQVLSAPLDTQAKELRKRAEEAYANGWIDEALEDFLESEAKNRYDFSIHISLGMIYLFQKIDKQKSLEYFDKAIKYAKPKSNYHTSFALLHKGLIYRDLGQLKEAEQCTAEATSLSPDFAEAYYQNAMYNALMGRRIDELKKAIKLDPNYILKAYSDDCFSNVTSQLDSISAELRTEQSIVFNGHKQQLMNKIDKLTDLIGKLNEYSSSTLRENSLLKIDEIKKLMNKYTTNNAFFDYMHFNTKLIDDVKISLSTVCDNLQKQLNYYIGDKSNELASLNSKRQQAKSKTEGTGGGLAMTVMIIGGIISTIVGMKGCYASLRRGEAFSHNPIYPIGQMIPALVIGAIVTLIIAGMIKMFFSSGASSYDNKNSNENKIESEIVAAKELLNHTAFK